MARTNLSLGNLYRAVSGSARPGAVSISGLNGGGSNISMIGFATDAITITPPTYTYIVESTTENAQFSFALTGSSFYNKVQQQLANFQCSFNNANFSTGSNAFGTGPTVIPITPAGINASNYSEASSVLTMKYVDGYNLNATNYNTTTTKTLYAVDVYNTINQPDFCLLFGTKVTKIDGSVINVEDLAIGDVIKAWSPTGLPDENLPIETDSVDWRFYFQEFADGNYAEVTVKDIVFNFANGYYSINNGLIKATGTHPIYIWDSEIEKYRFKNIEDILPGDLIVTYDEIAGISEIEVTNKEIITDDVEIVTINVEDADVYLANNIISHNKGTTTQPFIPSSGLRMYLDPSKARSFPADALPSTGTPTTDWLDLSGYNTGVRPAGVTNSAGYSGTSPAYNNGATRIDEYWTLDGSGTYWFKDRNSNINGGITQFDTSAMTFIAWVRMTANPGATYGCLFSKSGADRDYNFYLYSSGASAWDGFHFSSARGTCSNTVQTFTAPALNTWHMVAFTISAAAGITYYLNRSSVGTGTMSAFTATSSYDIKLGRDDNYAKCQLGPVLFYNTVLTTAEVQQVYDYFQPTYRP
jgi:Concanavalin A-like lectin/glucanases superfamily